MSKYLVVIFVSLCISGRSQTFFKVGVKTENNILYGVVNKNAENVIDPIFDNISMESLENGEIVFLVDQEKKQGILNEKGEKIMDIEYEDFYISTCYSNNILAKKNNKWGYYSDKGSLQIKHKYDSAGEFKNDTAIAYVNNRAYVLTINGKPKKVDWESNKIEDYYISDCVYIDLDASIVEESYDIMVEDGKFGVYDSYRNKWLIEQLYQNIIFDNNSGYYLVQLNSKWGFGRPYGKKISEFKYDSIAPLSTN